MWLRLREIDPRGSGSSARRSIPLTAQVQQFSSVLVKEIGLEGISMVEFKRPHNSASPVLMEINARPWGSLQLPISCGIDYPTHLVDWLLNAKRPPREIEYNQNITCRRLISELTHLEHTFRGTPSGLASTVSEFLLDFVEDFGALVSGHALRRRLAQGPSSWVRWSNWLVSRSL